MLRQRQELAETTNTRLLAEEEKRLAREEAIAQRDLDHQIARGEFGKNADAVINQKRLNIAEDFALKRFDLYEKEAHRVVMLAEQRPRSHRCCTEGVD